MNRLLCIVMVLAAWVASVGVAEAGRDWKPFTPIEDPPPMASKDFKQFQPFTPMESMEPSPGAGNPGAAGPDALTVEPNTSWKSFKPFPPMEEMELSPAEWGTFEGFRPMERLGPHPIKKYRNR